MESPDYNQYFLKYQRIGFVWSIMIVYRHALNYSVYTLQKMSIVCLIEKMAYELTGCATVGFAILAGYNFFRNYTVVDGIRKVKSRLYTQAIPYIIAASINWLFFCIAPTCSIYFEKNKWCYVSFFGKIISRHNFDRWRNTTLVFKKLNFSDSSFPCVVLRD